MDEIQNKERATSQSGRTATTSGPPLASAGRPVGVLLVAGMFFLLAVTVAVGLYFMVQQPGGIVGAFTEEPVTALLFFLTLPACLIIGVGLFQLHEWARVFACVFLVLATVRFFVDALLQYPIDVGLALGFTNSLIPAAILLYLSHPSIRPNFRRTTI